MAILGEKGCSNSPKMDTSWSFWKASRNFRSSPLPCNRSWDTATDGRMMDMEMIRWSPIDGWMGMGMTQNGWIWKKLPNWSPIDPLFGYNLSMDVHGFPDFSRARPVLTWRLWSWGRCFVAASVAPDTGPSFGSASRIWPLHQWINGICGWILWESHGDRGNTVSLGISWHN